MALIRRSAPQSAVPGGEPFSNNVFATEHGRDGIKRESASAKKGREEIHSWPAATVDNDTRRPLRLYLRPSVYFLLPSNRPIVPKQQGGTKVWSGRSRVSHCLGLFTVYSLGLFVKLSMIEEP